MYRTGYVDSLGWSFTCTIVGLSHLVIYDPDLIVTHFSTIE